MRSLFVLLIGAIIVGACTGNTTRNPITISDNQANNNLQQSVNPVVENNRYLWGYWNIAVSEDHTSATVTPDREASKHWNVLKFLEGGPCTNCVKVSNVTLNSDGSVGCDVEISHPFSNLNFCGFDVRGIALFNGSKTFPSAGLTAPDRFAGDGQLVNADGYTTLYNSGTASFAPFEGYYKGKLASNTNPSAQLNGFILHSSPSSPSDRNIFLAGDAVTQNYRIDMPSGAFVFGYAVDASWVPPTTKPVTDPSVDFAANANCPEPWRVIGGANSGPGLTDIGGYVNMWIYVYDHGGDTTHSAPKVEFPELWPGQVSATFDSTQIGYSVWTYLIVNTPPVPAGNYKILVSVEDNDNASSPSHLNLTTYQIFEVNVAHDEGFVKTWGGTDNDSAVGVDLDLAGNCFVAGNFNADPAGIDFDPGAGQDIHYSKGFSDCFLTKFDELGNHSWTVTFGGTGIDAPSDLFVLNDYEIYVTGFFSDTVDFAKSGTPVNRTSAGATDAFLACYDGDGDLTWVKTWGGSGFDSGEAMDGYWPELFVCGFFQGTADFDPDSGTFNMTSNGGFESCLSRYQHDGTWNASLSWGSSDDDAATAVTPFSGGYMISGWFKGNADLDPNPSWADWRNSAGFEDAYMIYMDNGNNYQFMRVVGGPLSDHIWDATAKLTDVYIAGSFGSTVDFNSSGTPENRSSNGSIDAFLLDMDTYGNYQWVQTWGGLDTDYAGTVEIAPSNEVFVGGEFGSSVDFDPGAGVQLYFSNGLLDCYISSFLSSGVFQWVHSFGSSTSTDYVNEIASFDDNSIEAVGSFFDSTDFDPTGGSPVYSNGMSDAYFLKYQNDGTW